MKGNDLYSIKMRASSGGNHISGAEGIYSEAVINDIVSSYMKRAFRHVKGRPDRLKIKAKALKEEPRTIGLLNIVTIESPSNRSAKNILWELLCHLGVSHESIRLAVEIIYSTKNMRGAAVINTKGAQRLEPDPERGIRASELGIDAHADTVLSERLGVHGLDTPTVKEAVVLASKVASHSAVIAELCISDDTDYTTGYIASSELGYIRIPNIKKYGSEAGGRVFFIRDSADMQDLVEYLETTPVMVNRIADIKGEVAQSEFFGDLIG